MVSPTGQPASLTVCEGDGLFSLLIANTSGSTVLGATLRLDLPTSCRYKQNSVTNATELDLSNLNQPTFSLPDIPNNTSLTIAFNAEIICGYDNSEDFNYIVTHNNSVYSGYDSPLQNYYYPSIVISNITNSSATIQINQSVTRDFTIEQQGLASSLDTLIILDEHTTDIEVVSVNLGVLKLDGGLGPTLVDTIIITGADMPGGNNLFDYGETIILSETVKLVGCTNGQSTINATWGCYGDYCASYFAYPSVSTATGVPLIDISFTGNNKGWGFIDNSGFIEFTVTNNGTGAGIAYDLVTLGGFSSSGTVYYPNNNWHNEVDSFSVNGNYLSSAYNYATGAINGQYAYYFNYTYTFDPDGPGVGIEDVDGDGLFDDLPVGNSVTVKAHTYYNWQEAILTIPYGSTCGRGWTNNAWQGFRYGYDLTDQCSSQPGATWVTNTNLLLFMTANTNTLEHTIPADIYDGTTVWMEQLVSTNTKVDDDGCPNDSVIYIVNLPDGVVIGGGTSTFKGVTMGTPLIVGNTATFFLNKNKVKSGGRFNIPLQINCAVPHDPTGTIETSLKFWCDKTNYPARFFTYWCSDSPVFGIQCPPGSCLDPYLADFFVERTTMGWTDNHLSHKANSETPGIQLDHALARDSIRIVALGSLSSLTDSLCFELQHDNLPGGWSNQLFFDYISDTLEFYDLESNTWIICPNPGPEISNGSTSKLTLNLSALTLQGGCLEDYSFGAGDSVRYIINGQVRNVTKAQWETVPGFRAHFYGVESGQKEFCNDRGSTFSILGSNYPFLYKTPTIPNNIEGCDDLHFNGQIHRYLDICSNEITFPNEVRPYLVLDSIKYSLPEGFVYQTGTAVHLYRNIDGSLSSEAIADPIIEYTNNQVNLLFVRDKSWSYSAYIDCNKNQDRIDFYANASCHSTSPILYQVTTSGRYQFYTDGIGISQSATEAANKPYTPAEIAMTPLITTAEGIYDTAYWEVRLCNQTNIDSENNWLAFENASNGIEITELIDITDPEFPIPIPATSYGPGNSWAQLGAIDGNNCAIYQIRATYSNCNSDSLFVRHAFNCVGYPINPELGYPPTAYSCNEISTYLHLEPTDVNLNLLVVSPPNPVLLCDTLTYEAEVTNTLLSYGYNLAVTLVLPPGVSVTNSSSEFSYPYTIGTYVTIDDPLNLPLGSNQWVYNLSSDPNAVQLLKGIDSIPNNGYKLRFRTLTDCDLISGTSIKVTASASNACGDIKARSSYTAPIIIDGLPTNDNLYVLSTENDTYLPTCNGSSTIKVKVINLGPNSVSNIEILSASIDDAYNYVPGSITSIHNGPSGVNNNIVIGGIRYLQFLIQPNLPVNDSIVFTYDLIDIDPGSLNCDTIPLTISAMLAGAVPCSTIPSGSCEIQSITSSLTVNLTVQKDNVEFGDYIAHSIPAVPDAELVTIDYSIVNSGTTPFKSDSIGVLFFHDANENGIADESVADSLFYQKIEVANLPAGNSVSSTVVFNVLTDKVCNLLAVIRLDMDTCICSETTLTVSEIQLLNAGADTMVCVQQELQIGTDSLLGQSYIWVPSTYLSSSTLANPEFLYTGILNQPDTLFYTLITTRPGDCMNKDTIQIIVYPNAIASAGSDEHCCETHPFKFSNSSVLPNVSNYDSVRWSGGTGIFDNPNALLPVYWAGNNEVGPVELFITAFSKLNCSQDISSMILTFDTLPDPSIAFSPNSSICANEPIYFTGNNNNSTPIRDWLWDFGDGTLTTGQNVIHTFLLGGSYPVKLYLTNDLGCTDSLTQVVIVNELPIASIDLHPSDTMCAELDLTLNGNSTTNITSWDWDFGDNSTGFGQNTNHRYNISGKYIIQLFVENNNGCTDTVIDSIYIRDLPTAEISFLPQDTSCLNETVYFNGLSNNNMVDWSWDFGDGATSTVQNPVHTYTQSGNFIVTLIFENIKGCVDTITKPIYVRQPPISDFTVSPSDTCCVYESVLFTGFSQDNINQWYWEFGDGDSGSGQIVSHEYLQPGNYTISLIFTDKNGCTDTVSHQKIVDNPFIDFTLFPNPVCIGDTTYFESIGQNITYATYNWDFGDGVGSGIGYENKYLYPESGTYDVSLHVCSKNIVLTQLINPVCVVNSGGIQYTCQGVYFDYSRSIIPPTASNYDSIRWFTTGMGHFDDPRQIAPTYFPDPLEGLTENDTLAMTMVGYGLTPCSNDTSTMQLVIIPGASAHAGSDESTCFGVPFDFANSADSSFAMHHATLYWLTSGTGHFTDPNVSQPIYIPGTNEIGEITMTMVAANIINCDSIDEMILTIRPVYEIPVDITLCHYDSIFAQDAWQYSTGIYFDTLQTNTYGCDSVIVTNLSVRPKINHDFMMSQPSPICLEESITFTPTGTAQIIDQLWVFGDGATSALLSPTHTYSTPGDYQLIYYYTDQNSCSDSITLPIQVNSLPDVDFTMSVLSSCMDTPIDFVGNSTSNIVSWDWDFGDGQTGTGQNIPHTYTTWGVMQVILTVTDQNGCSETALNTLSISQSPQANFTYSVDSCHTLHFVDASTAPPGFFLVSYDWDMGDGNVIHDDPEFSYSYANGGLYNVTLTVTVDSSNHFCSNTVTLPVIVPNTPTIYYTFDPDTTCLGETTFFYGASGTQITSWYWNFDDGLDTLGQYTGHIYDNPGSYDVTLYITDTNLCQNSLTQTVIINDIPDVTMQIFSTPNCAGSTISFMGDSPQGIASWMWDFGDGGISEYQNPDHIFVDGGTYTITLTATDSAGCSGTTTGTVQIVPGPTADYTFFMSGCNLFEFTDLSTAPAGFEIVGWAWDFGDGSTSVYSDPTHNYAVGGFYDVKLVVTSEGVTPDHQCTDSITQTILAPDAPSAHFVWSPNPAQINTSITFVGTSGSTITDWSWDFGDGYTGVGQTVGHIYTNPGDYEVTLRLTDDNNCTFETTQIVSVAGLPPVDFSWSYPCEETPIQFTVDETITDVGAVAIWAWDFGDGVLSSDQNPLHAYLSPGLYNATLYIVDTAGYFNSVSHEINVNPNPFSVFAVENPSCEGSPTQFTDYSIAPSGIIATWYWDFGDGTTQTVLSGDDPDIFHIYTTSGTYTITLTVTTSDSCQNTSMETVAVNPSPIAAMDVTYDCASGPIIFHDVSNLNGSGDIIGRVWDFGDPASGANNTSVLENPTHIFSSPGDYTITLVIESSSQCTDTATMELTITEPPVADFTHSPACRGEEVSFTITDLTNLSSFYWDFGDGNSSNLENPINIYDIPGDYEVTLVVQTTDACTASVSQTVTVNELPTARFEYSEPTCQSDSIFFLNLSNSPNGAIVKWEWDFGDGTIVTILAPNSSNATHVFANDQTYVVTLTVTDSDSCQNSLQKEVEALSSPVAEFNWEDACFGTPTYFYDLTNSTPDIAKWYWDFGDPLSGVNNTNTLKDPTHEFTDIGDFTVTLIATNTFGCDDTITHVITVTEGPDVGIQIIQDTICALSAVYFEGISSSEINTWFWDFGDGGYAIAQNTEYIYQTPGTYTVYLTVTAFDGCQSTASQQIIVNDAPIANFRYEKACTGDVTLFYDESYSALGYLNAWTWDFGDGSTSTEQNPTHQYAGNNNYTVQLISLDNFGCSDTIEQQIQIHTNPTAAMTFVQACEPAGQVFFFDQSEPSSDGSPIQSWEWILDQGNYSTEIDPEYIYDVTDTCYQIIQTVTDDNGCSNTDTTMVCLFGTLEIDISATSVCLNQPTTFYTSYLPLSDSVIGYEWNFHDGTPIQTTTFDTIQHIFSSPGIYNVELNVLDTNGCSDFATIEVKIDSLPDAKFSYVAEMCDVQVQFTDESLNGGAAIVSWYWEFGDISTGIDNISTLAAPMHQFVSYDSIYQVKLVVTNLNGCIDSVTHEVYVGPCLVANFEVPVAINCTGYQLCFTDISSLISSDGIVTQWSWDFGDGTTLNYENPQDQVCHSYLFAGTYKVELSVEAMVDDIIYQDAVVRTIQVEATPDAIIITENNCLEQLSIFSDGSNVYDIPIVSWQWDFDTINRGIYTSDLQNPLMTYPNPGNFVVEMIVTNEVGCMDTANKEMTVYNLPIASFHIEDTCQGYTTSFIDDSRGNDGDIVTWKWNFGDNNDPDHNMSLRRNSSHIYSQTGEYTTWLYIQDQYTCLDSLSKVFTVNPVPSALYTLTEDWEGKQGLVKLDNLSQGAIYYDWYFDDGDTSQQENPTHQYIYDSDPIYYLTLIATNNFGCPDTLVYPYELIFTGLFVPNAFSPSVEDPTFNTFKPVGVNLSEYELEVFNSWGNRVFSSSKLNDGQVAEGWDGAFEGEDLPTGVYIWRITARFSDGSYWRGSDNGDGNSQTNGTVTLIR